MAFVVAEPCIKCKYTDCVAVCPVNCFHEGANFLAIDPDACIDCGVCVDECPVYAIFPVDEVPDKWADYIALNREYSKKWPVIRKIKPAPADADDYREVDEKRDLFDPAPGGEK